VIVPPDWLPRLVVTKITPLAPRAPYIAVEEASLSTSMEAISLGFIKSIGVLPLVNPVAFRMTPSITYKGLLDTLTEVLPRIRIFALPPGRPELTETLTPVNRPAKA